MEQVVTGLHPIDLKIFQSLITCKMTPGSLQIRLIRNKSFCTKTLRWLPARSLSDIKTNLQKPSSGSGVRVDSLPSELMIFFHDSRYRNIYFKNISDDVTIYIYLYHMYNMICDTMKDWQIAIMTAVKVRQRHRISRRAQNSEDWKLHKGPGCEDCSWLFLTHNQPHAYSYRTIQSAICAPDSSVATFMGFLICFFFVYH